MQFRGETTKLPEIGSNTSWMILMQMKKVNHEKGYFLSTHAIRKKKRTISLLTHLRFLLN